MIVEVIGERLLADFEAPMRFAERLGERARQPLGQSYQSRKSVLL
jgi:hypothetical protein